MALQVSKLPDHPLAKLALATSVAAAVLAGYGAYVAEAHLPGSPLNAARGGPGLAAAGGSEAVRVAIQAGAFVAPVVLGVLAGWLGGSAIRAIERASDRYSGNFAAVFAVMIGGLAAVVGATMCFALYAWPHLPALEAV